MTQENTEETTPSDVEQVMETTPSPEAPTLAQLKVELMSKMDDDAEVMRISRLILKQKSDVEKAEAARMQAEAVTMAAGREKLAKSLLKVVKGTIDTTELVAVKAKGFTFHLADETSDIPYLGLIVPTVRKAGGGGGGSTGALKQQTGLARHELVDQYATEAEKATIAKAGTDATSRPDSARYGAEKPVIKRILGDNPHLIKR